MDVRSKKAAIENAEQEALRKRRFREVIEYALGRASDGDKERTEISQRQLADLVDVAPTMVTRYLTGQVDPYALKLITVDLLADACGLDVGTVVRWISEGRDAAMAHEEKVCQEPVGFSPLDLARRLVELLRGPELGSQPELVLISHDYQRLRERLGEVQAVTPEGAMDAVIDACGAGEALERVDREEPLTESDWVRLGCLFRVMPDQLRQECTLRRGPGAEPKMFALPA